MAEHADKYFDIAETYDLMLPRNPERSAFFSGVFRQNRVKTVLDCACGTGKDLALFASLGLEVTGSDLSDAMLRVARKRMKDEGVRVALHKADFQHLPGVFRERFDAVVCLSNAINEIEVDVLKALRSMRAVLNDRGIIIFDQGQTDASMRNPPRSSLAVNTRDLSRLFTMDYRRDIMTVNIFDIHHACDRSDLVHHEFKIKIRLGDDWARILRAARLGGDFYGWWDSRRYNKRSSPKFIAVARKKGPGHAARRG